jgi:hypothetical protein
MKNSRRCVRQTLVLICLLSAVLALPVAASSEEIRLDGAYVLSPSGDVLMTVKLTASMMLYQTLRQNVSNLYLVLRQLASSRADTEVVDQKADWDDPNRTMTFSMKLLGASRNFGNHWELEIPKGTEFINLDEGKRTFYFNETAEAGSLANIRGTSKLLMPPEARDFKWEGSRRVIVYAMPPVKAASTRNMTLLVLGGVLMLLGISLTAGSFFLKS